MSLDYFFILKNNLQFKNRIKRIDKDCLSLTFFKSFLRIEYYNDSDLESEFFDIDRIYFKFLGCKKLRNYTVKTKDFIDMLENFDVESIWFFSVYSNHDIISDSKCFYEVDKNLFNYFTCNY